MISRIAVVLLEQCALDQQQRSIHRVFADVGMRAAAAAGGASNRKLVGVYSWVNLLLRNSMILLEEQEKEEEEVRDSSEWMGLLHVL